MRSAHVRVPAVAVVLVAVVLVQPALAQVVDVEVPLEPAPHVATTTGSPSCDTTLVTSDLDGCREWESTRRGLRSDQAPSFGFIVDEPSLVLVVGREVYSTAGCCVGATQGAIVAYETDDGLAPFNSQDGKIRYVTRFATPNASLASDSTRIADAALSPDRTNLAVAGVVLLGTFPCSDGRDPPTIHACYDHGTLVSVVRAASGERPWTLVRGTVDGAWSLGESVAWSADGSRLFATASEGPIGGPRALVLLALDAATGAVAWEKVLPDEQPSTLLVASDGRVLVGTTGAYGGGPSLLVVDPGTGALLGEHALPAASTSTVASLHETPDGFLHAAAATQLTALDASFAVVWTRTLGGDSTAWPNWSCCVPKPEIALAPGNEVAYALDHGPTDAVVALDLATGADVWRWTAPRGTALNGVDADAGGVRASGDADPRDQDTLRASGNVDVAFERPLVGTDGNRGRDLFVAALTPEGALRWAAYDDPGYVRDLQARGVVVGDGRVVAFARVLASSNYAWYVAAHKDLVGGACSKSATLPAGVDSDDCVWVRG